VSNSKQEGDHMLWNELFDDGHEPLDSQIKEFVETPLWDDLADYLRQTYNVQPKLFYSCCSMQKGFWKGWNVKYKKNSKALCTLYPKQGYFVALIAVGAKEMAEADLVISLCDEYTQDLYGRTIPGAVGKSLAVEVTSESILRDVKNLIALRVCPRKM
jgi:AraC family transcriptional regulator